MYYSDLWTSQSKLIGLLGNECCDIYSIPRIWNRRIPETGNGNRCRLEWRPERSAFHGWLLFNLVSGGGAIGWQVKKQTTVSLSSCEAEYQGLASAVQEVVQVVFYKKCCKRTWVRAAEAYSIYGRQPELYWDCNEPRYTQEVETYYTKFHFIREKLKDKQIELIYTCHGSRFADKIITPH